MLTYLYPPTLSRTPPYTFPSPPTFVSYHSPIYLFILPIVTCQSPSTPVLLPVSLFTHTSYLPFHPFSYYLSISTCPTWFLIHPFIRFFLSFIFLPLLTVIHVLIHPYLVIHMSSFSPYKPLIYLLTHPLTHVRTHFSTLLTSDSCISPLNPPTFVSTYPFTLVLTHPLPSPPIHSPTHSAICSYSSA